MPQEIAHMYQSSPTWRFFVEREGCGIMYDIQELKTAGISIAMATHDSEWIPDPRAFIAVPFHRLKVQYFFRDQEQTVVVHFPAPPSDIAAGVQHIHLDQAANWNGPGYDPNEVFPES